MIRDDPPRLTLVLDGLLRIEGWTPTLRAACEAAGLHVESDAWGYHCVRFDAEPIDLRQNRSAIRALRLLAAQGVAFARDCKQTYDPAYSVQYLREAGLLEGEILTCAFDGRAWNLETG
jgi:hypothetical protein